MPAVANFPALSIEMFSKAFEPVISPFDKYVKFFTIEIIETIPNISGRNVL